MLMCPEQIVDKHKFYCGAHFDASQADIKYVPWLLLAGDCRYLYLKRRPVALVRIYHNVPTQFLRH